MNSTTPPAPAAPGTDLCLQRLCLPDLAICTETDLYVHLNDMAFLRIDAGEVVFLPGGRAWFDTYMNLFNLGVWTRACTLGGLVLKLQGTGQFHLRVWRAEREGDNGQTLVEDVVTLTPEGLRFDLGAAIRPSGSEGMAGPQNPDDQGNAPADTGLSDLEGVIMLRLTAMGEGTLTGGGFYAPAPAALPEVRLAISVTTFRREAEVEQTAARVVDFLDGEGAALLAALNTSMHLFVVDNGQSAKIAPHPRLTLIPNANLGGAGGFARGLAAATDADFTHCLFMDDDASFQMEALLRTAAFLALARSPKAALSGAMISTVKPWMMWENGAVFDRLCRPQHVGTDLRSALAVTRMELAAARANQPGFYAGWWYFAFPIAQVRHFPFPFFVRGDDISFSLAHDFDTVTLNGVVSFQEDFSAKESPLTLYLDLRNHLHQHLVHDGMDIGATGTAKIVARFLVRSIVRMHYESGAAQLEAWEDVMKGPAFFADNADMMKRRPEILALAKTETWHPVEPGDLTLPALEIDKDKEPSLFYGKVMRALLNGHVVPFWRRLGRAVRIPLSHRGLIWPIWGLKEAVFFNADGSKAYRVRHSKRQGWGLLWRAFKMYWRWRRVYPGLRDAHRQGYAEMAARPFWEERFLKDFPQADTTTHRDA